MATCNDDVIVVKRAADWSLKLCQRDTIRPAPRATLRRRHERSFTAGRTEPKRAKTSPWKTLFCQPYP